MPTHDIYGAQVALLLRTLPFVAAEPVFALKGGTAINFFVRDLPRLSVDIDLTYVPVARPRDLREIQQLVIPRSIPSRRISNLRAQT